MHDIKIFILPLMIIWCGGFLIGLTLGSMIEKTTTEICIEVIDA